MAPSKAPPYNEIYKPENGKVFERFIPNPPVVDEAALKAASNVESYVKVSQLETDMEKAAEALAALHPMEREAIMEKAKAYLDNHYLFVEEETMSTVLSLMEQLGFPKMDLILTVKGQDRKMMVVCYDVLEWHSTVVPELGAFGPLAKEVLKQFPNPAITEDEVIYGLTMIHFRNLRAGQNDTGQAYPYLFLNELKDGVELPDLTVPVPHMMWKDAKEVERVAQKAVYAGQDSMIIEPASLLSLINQAYSPNLGLATTAQLHEELKSRLADPISAKDDYKTFNPER